MAKLRAYKLAEELGIERDEFVQKVRELGIELRSAMAALEEAQVDEIRRRLGGVRVQERVVKRVGDRVIRRRRRPTPAPEPEAPVVEEPGAAAVDEPAAAQAEEVGAEPAVEEAPAVSAEQEQEQEQEQEVPEVAAVAAKEAEAVTPVQPPAGAAPTQTPVTPVRDEALPPATSRATPSRRPVRREAELAAKLKEQDTLARTLLGNVQHRLEQRRLIVEQQSRINPRRRRAGGARKPPPQSAATAPRKIVRLNGPITFAELSRRSGTKARDLLRRARQVDAEIERGDRLDVETVALMLEDLDVEVQISVVDLEEDAAAGVEDSSGDMAPRSPVVTVMGHVDHGKTSLLDTIRKANVVAGEAGGITQHIGAYQVKVGDDLITFIDTPGHAAFTQMRARGAAVTDIVVLVIAADDGVMPQTVEAIAHARAAGVPIIVAINKIDLPNADVQRARQALLEHELVPEELGGDVICVEVSATKGTNVDGLLESLVLQAEILELEARATGKAVGTVIEARLDKGRGPVATLLVRAGVLQKGDLIVAGSVGGRVRSMADENGRPLEKAGPATPVQVVGLSSVPEVSDEFLVVETDREAKQLVEHRQLGARREASGLSGSTMSAEDVFGDLGADEDRELRIVLKSDVRGTLEAVRDAAVKLSTNRVTAKVIHAGVGGVGESDVILASASSALIYGFHVRPDAAARRQAEGEGVQVRCFDLIHELLDDVAASMSGLLPPKITEKVTGHAEVKELFVIPRVGTVAGSAVPEGVIRRSNLIRVMRNGVPIYSGRVASLRHFKEDVREVQSGRECGIRVENFDDVKVGDILESYLVEETPDTL